MERDTDPSAQSAVQCREVEHTGVSRGERVFPTRLETMSGVSTVIVLKELRQDATKTFEEKKVGLAEITKAPMHESAQRGVTLSLRMSFAPPLGATRMHGSWHICRCGSMMILHMPSHIGWYIRV